MSNTLTIQFTPPTPAPANGYRVQYWNVNNPSVVNTVSPNPTTSPVSISGLAAGCYNGTIEAACGGSQYSSPIQFNACSAASCLTGTLSATGNCSGGQTSTFSLATGQQATVSMSGFYYSGTGTRTITGSLLDNSNNVIQNFTYTQTGASVGTTSPTSYQVTNSSGSSVTYKLQVNQVNCSTNGSGTGTMTVGNCQSYTSGGGGGTGAAYCVQVTSEGFSEASSECSGFNDSYTVYTFTLKDSNGNAVNAPSAVTITFNGWTNYPGGAGAFNGNATINSGSSTTTSTVYTSQALNGAPGCPCPCETTISVDANSFAASIASPNTVSICGPTYYYYSVNKYLCDNSCALAGSTFVARSTTQLSTTSGTHYLVGNATYVVNTQITPAPSTYDVNLDGASTGSSCAGLCPSGGSGGSGGGSGGGGGVTTYDCVNGNCVATVGGGYNSLVECQQSGCAGGGGQPQE